MCHLHRARGNILLNQAIAVVEESGKRQNPVSYRKLECLWPTLFQ